MNDDNQARYNNENRPYLGQGDMKKWKVIIFDNNIQQVAITRTGKQLRARIGEER